MTEFPKTTPLPPPPFMPAQSPKNSGPTNPPVPTPLPPSHLHSSLTSTSSEESHAKKPLFPLPTLRLEIRDLNHPGASDFLAAVNTSKALATSVQSVLRLLYHSPSYPTTTVPSTRSVTLVLRSMGGVAYTTGSDLDDDHKEIHFSLEYIHQISASRKHDEILGVLTHEMVHCYQYNGFGTAPGGLIEGIADWVRLNAGLDPPHWKQEADGEWDGGYQHTGYFLEYLERRFGEGTVRRVNEKLRIERYDAKRFWTALVGGTVEALWGDYAKWLKKKGGKGEKGVKTEESEAEDQEVDGCVIVEKTEADEGNKPTPTVEDVSK